MKNEEDCNRQKRISSAVKRVIKRLYGEHKTEFGMQTDRKTVDKTLAQLRRRQFAAYYCETAEEGKNLALSLIPEGDSVAWGGSRTAEQIGLIEAIRNAGKFTVIDRDKARNADEKAALMRQGLSADTFISGINALSSDGWIVNIDGTGNRIAATVYGPRNIIFVVGVNKLVDGGVEEAIDRARNVAAPLNAQRFDIATPCKKTGKCADCLTPCTICSQFVLTRFCKPAERIKVILIGEELGF